MDVVRRFGWIVACAAVVATWIAIAIACDEDGNSAKAAQPASIEAGTLPVDPEPLCQLPACGPDTCATFNPTTPFVRLPQATNAPVLDDSTMSNCFGVAKTVYPNGSRLYVLIDGYGGTPSRWMSRNGITWFKKTMSFPNGTLHCPDPAFADTTNMYIYYWDGSGVGYAVSADQGDTWTNAQQVFNPTNSTHYLYQPSVVPYRGGYLMAYTWACKGWPGTAPLASSVIRLARSWDRIHWSDYGNGPAIITSPSCTDWDNGSVNRPRLLVEADGTTLHLFYQGIGWVAGKTSTRCMKIGHAVSSDSGMTWVKSPLPVLDRPTTVHPGWDTRLCMEPAPTWETGKLRMFYRGISFGPVIDGIGVAEMNWPGPLLTEQMPASVGDPAPELPGRIAIWPNPTRSGARLALDFGSAEATSDVHLAVLDVAGRTVRRLHDGAIGSLAPVFEWDGRSDGGDRVHAGRYMVELRSADRRLATSWVTILP